MSVQYRCKNEERRQAVKQSNTFNGIDYLEVSQDQLTLEVHFFHPLPDQPGAIPEGPALTRDNVVIEGGVRVQNPPVEFVSAKEKEKVLMVGLTAYGDFSAYTLRLVKAPGATVPPDGFDRQLSEVQFFFKVDCPSDFDCSETLTCPTPVAAVPPIDYLAKDYASFQRLLLDRLAVIMPDWQERSPADVGIMLVELLAYAGDYLSYFQDAVATEAYLGTARRRTSVRRHARLVDYHMHDGANARAWVVLQVDADSVKLPQGTQFLTKVENLPVVLQAEDVSPAVSAGAEVFESLDDVDLHAVLNEIHFYTWGDTVCCLPKGATRATLLKPAELQADALKAGHLLLFEEVKGPESGEKADADPNHRHVVRLTLDPLPITDSLVIDGKPPQQLLEVEWAHEDALPFPLCLSTETVPHVSVARGNVVLVDHGRTRASEPLASIPERGDYRPALQFGPLTQQGYMYDRCNQLVLFNPDAPASAFFHWQIQTVKPAIRLHADGTPDWLPQRELLNSARFATEFVVETENDGRAYLRFGDGVLGQKPVKGLSATYRVGNGRTGNVGAEAIAHVVTALAGISDKRNSDKRNPECNPVRNPLPAQGGTEPETLEQVRLYAPQAFRTQERAVTEADYAEVAGRHPDVQKAAATRRWTGSWYTMFITIDRKGGRPVDATFRRDMRQFLERFRLAGYDLDIQSPIFVPLDIAFTVCVKPDYFRSKVKKALLEAFSNTDLPDGRRGFFHPDNFTFGTPVYLSQIVDKALQVPGVNWIDTDNIQNRFQRWGQDPHGELTAGEMKFARLEIARLDNDPNQPENGKLEFFMQGGL